MQRITWIVTSAIVIGAIAAANADDAGTDARDGSGSGSDSGSGGGSGSEADAAVSTSVEPGANEHAQRRADESVAQMFHGPFQSSRLFTMPIADVVGAYMVTVSEEGSLLQQPGVLSSAGVVAIGFGDIAQLEYRHTSVISVTGVDEPVPSVGAQLKIPIPERPNVPAIGLAFRLGVARDEQVGTTTVSEKVTDLYIVARERLAAIPWLTMHAGVRVSPSTIALGGDRTGGASSTLTLPAAGLEVAMNPTARLVGEVGLVPQFAWTPTSTADPTIHRAVLARIGLRWALLPALTLDASLGYQLAAADAMPDTGPRDIVQQWDIRLGAEVFVPWGALACRALGAFCN